MAGGADSTAQELLEQGASLYEDGKLYEALSCWKQVLQLDPGNEIASEYLRFIEDNFQIGVDAFMEHHATESAERMPIGTAPPISGGGSVPPRPPPDPFASVPPSQQLPMEESIEELDWSEILDAPDAPDGPPPLPLETVEGDEDFFAELGPNSLTADPGEEARAWGMEEVSSGAHQVDAEASEELMPAGDPLSLPRSHFTGPYRPPPQATDPAIGVSQEILPGAPGSRRPTTRPVDVSGLSMAGPGSGLRARKGRSGAMPVVSPPPPEKDRDLAEMTDESIELMLDMDFRAWEEGQAAPGQLSPDDSADLEALLSAGFESEEQLAALAEARPKPLNVEDITGPSALPEGLLAGEDSPREEMPSDILLPPILSPTPEPMGIAPPVAAPSLEPPPVVPTLGSLDDPVRFDQLDTALTPPPDLDADPTPEMAPEPLPEPEPEPEPDGIEDLLREGFAAIDSIEHPPVEQTPAPRQLITAPPADSDFDAMMAEARRKQQAGDFSGSLELVEKVLAGNADHVEARQYLTENTDRLLAMYRSRLGEMSRCPKAKLRQSEIMWQKLDHRAAFVLSQVDGMTSYEDIIEISGMNEFDSTRVLARLVQAGVIG